MRYIADHCSGRKTRFCGGCVQKRFSGFNVTIPYKEKIIPYLDEVDDAVRACGAVNTVDIREGRMIGHITDGSGYASQRLKKAVSLRRRCVLFLAEAVRLVLPDTNSFRVGEM